MCSLLWCVFLWPAMVPLQEKPPAQEDQRPVVELRFAKEHVPANLPPGDKMDIMIVTGKTVTRTGQVSMSFKEFVRNAEVTFWEQVKEPKQPWEAVFVKLRVTPEQAEQIRKIKRVEVAVYDSQKKLTKRPVPLHLERSKKDSK